MTLPIIIFHLGNREYVHLCLKHAKKYKNKRTGGDKTTRYGTLIYWNPNKFARDSHDVKINISNHGLSEVHPYRPCVGIRLIHRNTGLKYIIINI